MPPGDEMGEVDSCCLPHRQLWVLNLSSNFKQWLEVDLNLRPTSVTRPRTYCYTTLKWI